MSRRTTLSAPVLWAAGVIIVIAFILFVNFMAAHSARERWLEKATLPELEDAIAQSPDDEAVLYTLAFKKAQNGDSAAAVKLMRRLVAMQPHSGRYWMGMARCAAQDGKLEETVQAYKKAYEMDPKQAAAHSYLGQIYQRAGLSTDALEEINTAMRIDPKAPINVLIWADCLLARGQTREAWDAVYHSISLEPVQDQLYPALTDIGIRLGRRAELESILLARIKLTPMYPVANARFSLARLILAKSHDRDTLRQAEELDRTAIQEKNPNANAALAEVLLLEKDIKGARAALEQGLRIQAANANCLRLLAEIDERQGDVREAKRLRDRISDPAADLKDPEISALKKAVRRAPGDIALRKRLAALLEKHEGFGAAAEEYHEILRRTPGDTNSAVRLNSCRDAAIKKLAASDAVNQAI